MAPEVSAAHRSSGALPPKPSTSEVGAPLAGDQVLPFQWTTTPSPAAQASFHPKPYTASHQRTVAPGSTLRHSTPSKCSVTPDLPTAQTSSRLTTNTSSRSSPWGSGFCQHHPSLLQKAVVPGDSGPSGADGRSCAASVPGRASAASG